MRYFFIFTLALLFVTKVSATEKIKEAKISFQLPNDRWELKDKQNQNGMTVYFYKREPVMDENKREIIPNISFIIEDINKDSVDVVTYAIMKRDQLPIDITEVFSHEGKRLNFVNAMANKGTYKDENGEHTVYVLFLINNNKGVMVIMDILTCVFQAYEEEFLEAMRSMKNY